DKTARLAMIISVLVNLGILFFFKYIGFFTENLNKIPGIELKVLGHALPLGISFYTFQILSYSVDVYRGKAKCQKNIINLAAYITLFPQLIAGPIVRYETVAEQLDKRNENFNMFGDGVNRFVTGLGKKVLIANMCGEIFDKLSGLAASENTVILSWICSIAFSLQIYFDFSGYSDMAIGLGKMFGFEFLENFDYPYISKSITEFWRRWHISLSTWFRDYVYIPLGGNRRGKGRTLLNIFIVWLLTGFWHGAEWNFIIWGLYYFVLLMLEKLFLLEWLKKAPGVISRLYSLFFINLGWVIFAYDKMPALKNAVLNMFGGSGLALSNDLTIYYLISFGLFFVIAFVAATPLPKKLVTKLLNNKNEGLVTGLNAVFIL
ncbi:MAG: MBOAT family protein, partial [Lachnospiraceae bacterium]|nr:MBOAT family protein [Lachnospiraceae bacterium]